jgi:hypothetical protein
MCLAAVFLLHLHVLYSTCNIFITYVYSTFTKMKLDKYNIKADQMVSCVICLDSSLIKSESQSRRVCLGMLF